MQNPSHTPIGLFDSGVGGLTVLENLVRVLPGERYVYFGDTLHMPYGSKSFQEIRLLVDGILDWLCVSQQVKLVAVACNTSAGVLYPLLEELCPVPLVEPITPICEWLATEDTFRKVGLIATPTTVRSERYPAVLASMTSKIEMTQVACDGLAKMIESGDLEDESHAKACRTLLKGYLDPLIAWGTEALILGCTHYPHARRQIAELLPDSLQILDPADFMSQKVYRLLDSKGLLSQDGIPGEIDYHVSHDPDAFLSVSRQLPLNNLQLRETPSLTVVNPQDFLSNPGTSTRKSADEGLPPRSSLGLQHP